jgi:uncharacterized protein DUF4307
MRAVTDLATRYGTSNPSRRRLIVTAVSLLGLVFLGWVAWAAFEHGDPEVTSDLVSYDVVDQHAATATFRVARRTSEVKASCLLRAQAADHATVGELNVQVGPGGDRVQTLTRRVRTEREATTVEAVGCTAKGQSRPR